MTSHARHVFSRRQMLAGAATTGALCAIPFDPAAARAPLVNTQAPAFYRFRIGAIEATVISDGPLPLGEPAAFFKGIGKPTLDKLLEDNFAPTPFVAEQNALVLNTGDRLILVDTGMGSSKAFGPYSGRLRSGLKAAGIDEKDIDAVVITHAHIDHIAGLAGAGGTRGFPNAQIFMTQADYDFWTDEGKLGSPLKDLIQVARDVLPPNRGRIVFVQGGQEILPGIQALATPGHTVGHISLLISSEGKTLCNTADVVHHYVLAPLQPRVEFAFDTDPKLAVESRIRLFDMLAADRIPMLAYHFPWPGIGHIAKSGEDSFRYFPMPMQMAL